MRVTAEFTVYPFEEGEDPPEHVQAAIDALSGAGLAVELGPLSQVVRGDLETVLQGLRDANLASLRAGASRVVVSIDVSDG